MNNRTSILVYGILIGWGAAMFLPGSVRQAAAASGYTMTNRGVTVAPEMNRYDSAVLSITFGKDADATRTDNNVSRAEFQADDLFDPCRAPETEVQPDVVEQAARSEQAAPDNAPQAIAAPEPGTLSLLGLGGLLLLFRLRRRS